jgi:hypothetical protein
MKFDILNLARETAYFDLEMPVSSALQKRSLVRLTGDIDVG